MVDWFAKHSRELSMKYVGKHIAIVEGKVVAAGKSPLIVFREAKSKYPTKKISLAYIPTDEETATLL